MTAFVDTSVVVRYLTGDPADQARAAASIIDAVDVQITDVVLIETAFVLGSVYSIPRDVVVDRVTALARKENISFYALNKGLVLEALLMCRGSGRVSFADAMIWAAARSAGAEVVYSMDRRFPAEGIEVRAGREAPLS